MNNILKLYYSVFYPDVYNKLFWQLVFNDYKRFPTYTFICDTSSLFDYYWENPKYRKALVSLFKRFVSKQYYALDVNYDNSLLLFSLNEKGLALEKHRTIRFEFLYYMANHFKY